MKKTLHGPGGLRVALDRSQVFPDDPGQGTPAMVYLFGYSSTFWAASGEGELLHSGDHPPRKLTPEQCRWLDEIEEDVTQFLYR
jgi:hypothetical protein